jgi:hypothetical protein
MKSNRQKLRTICPYLILLLLISFLLNTKYNILNISLAFAEDMSSQNFKLQGGDFTMTSGSKASPNYKLSDVVGETAVGSYTSKGYILNAGYLNTAAGSILAFSVSPTLIDFGSLLPNSPVVRSITLTIANGDVLGYRVKVAEDQPLSTNLGVEIPDTKCDSPTQPCTLAQGSSWNQETSYGFGYRMAGKTTPSDFLNSDYYRPFPSKRKNDSPALVMQSNARKATDQATMNLRVVVGRSQPVGQYHNVIHFTALAGI